jgi:hypothetical protein
MSRGDFISEIAVRLGFELVHDDAKHASSTLTRAATRGLHHAQIAARADYIAGFGQKLTDSPRLFIFRRILVAARAAEDSDNALL